MFITLPDKKMTCHFNTSFISSLNSFQLPRQHDPVSPSDVFFVFNELKQWMKNVSYKMICIFIGIPVFDNDSFNPILFPWYDFVQHSILICTAKWTLIFGE